MKVNLLGSDMDLPDIRNQMKIFDIVISKYPGVQFFVWAGRSEKKFPYRDTSNLFLDRTSMNWLQKHCATIPIEDMLDHAIKAVAMTLSGSWEVVENRPNLKQTYRIQQYGVATLHGKEIYQPGDEFLVKIFASVRRSLQDIPEEIYYDPEASNQWMTENTVPIADFDSTSGNNLVHFNAVVAGFIPGRNWSHKEEVRFWSTDNPMYEIGNTRGDKAEEPLSTPYDLAEWVRNTIERGYQDFGNDGEGNDDYFPEWPYPEGSYTDEPEEELSRIRAPRVRGYIG